MNINEIIKLFNEDGKTLADIGLIVGKSKSTVQRFIAKSGYVLNKETSKYTNNVSRETLQSSKTIKTSSLKNRTITLPGDLNKALKLKAVLEDKTSLEIIQDALRAYIEDKYFKEV